MAAHDKGPLPHPPGGFGALESAALTFTAPAGR